MASTSKKRRSKGTGGLIKLGSGYYAYQYVNAAGRRKTKSLRTKDRKEAEKRVKAYTKAQEASDREEVLLQIGKARKLIKSRDLPVERGDAVDFELTDDDGTWSCRWRDVWDVDGERYHNEPLRSKTRKRAKVEAERLTASPVWDAFLHTNPTASAGTRRNYRRALDDLVTWLKANRPSITSFTQVDAETASAYLASLWDTGITANTYQYRRNALGHITTRIAPQFHIDANPWLLTERKQGSKQQRLALKANQVTELLDSFDADDLDMPHQAEMKVLAMLCIYAGMRLKDACLLRWSNIDLVAGKIEYTPHKTARTGRTALVPILSPLRTVLTELERSCDPEQIAVLPTIAAVYERNPDGIQKPLVQLIHSVTGNREAQNGGTGQRKIARSAYGAHSLRHTFASMAAMAGAKPAYLARMLGDNITTVQKYYVHVGFAVSLVDGFADIPKMIEAKGTTEPERTELHRLADELPLPRVRELLRLARADDDTPQPTA